MAVCYSVGTYLKHQPYSMETYYACSDSLSPTSPHLDYSALPSSSSAFIVNWDTMSTVTKTLTLGPRPARMGLSHLPCRLVMLILAKLGYYMHYTYHLSALDYLALIDRDLSFSFDHRWHQEDHHLIHDASSSPLGCYYYGSFACLG